MAQLEVAFSGLRCGQGPVTMAQANVLSWIGDRDQERSDILYRSVPVPPGRGLGDLRETLAVLLARHEAPRTTVRTGSPAIQSVAGFGTLVVELHELTGDAEAVLVERLAAARFDFAADLPLRVAVATRNGRPYHAVLALSHLAADYASLELLGAQFAALLTDPTVREVGPVTHQPLDQAALEASPLSRQRAEAALRFWDKHLRRVPPCLLSLPAQGPPGFREGYLTSRAGALALPGVAARTGASNSAVLLAAAATLLAVRTGNSLGALTSICGNRFHSRMAGYIGTVAQDALVPFQLGSSTVDDVVRGMQLATMRAYRYGQFDARRLWQIIDAVADERGTRFQRDCVFNDIGAHRARSADIPVASSAAELAKALPDTTFQWLARSSYPVAWYLTVVRADEELGLALYADSRYLPAADIEGFLRGIEALLIASAEAPVPVAEVPEVTGLKPVDRGPGWCYVDSCWVELVAVQRLLDDVLGGHPARVFNVDGALVAYVAAVALTPREVHNRCVAALAGRYTAMAPGRYVICAGQPERLDEVAAWAARPVLDAGSGRA